MDKISRIPNPEFLAGYAAGRAAAFDEIIDFLTIFASIAGKIENRLGDMFTEVANAISRKRDAKSGT